MALEWMRQTSIYRLRLLRSKISSWIISADKSFGIGSNNASGKCPIYQFHTCFRIDSLIVLKYGTYSNIWLNINIAKLFRHRNFLQTDVKIISSKCIHTN